MGCWTPYYLGCFLAYRARELCRVGVLCGIGMGIGIARCPLSEDHGRSKARLAEIPTAIGDLPTQSVQIAGEQRR